MKLHARSVLSRCGRPTCTLPPCFPPPISHCSLAASAASPNAATPSVRSASQTGSAPHTPNTYPCTPIGHRLRTCTCLCSCSTRCTLARPSHARPAAATCAARRPNALRSRRSSPRSPRNSVKWTRARRLRLHRRLMGAPAARPARPRHRMGHGTASSHHNARERARQLPYCTACITAINVPVALLPA
jgi:hypothetical protein